MVVMESTHEGGKAGLGVMTATNARADNHGFVGSSDVPALMATDKVLYIERGGGQMCIRDRPPSWVDSITPTLFFPTAFKAPVRIFFARAGSVSYTHLLLVLPVDEILP